MFSLYYDASTVNIAILRVDRINVLLVKTLRKLVVQVIKQPCRVINFDMTAVRCLDRGSVECLKFIHEITSKRGIEFHLLNVNEGCALTLRHEDPSQILKLEKSRVLQIAPEIP